MSVHHTKMINKLQTALLKKYNVVVFVEKEQFFSERQNRVITMYVLYKRVFDSDKGHYTKKQIIKTADNVALLKAIIELYAYEEDKATHMGLSNDV